MKKVELTQERLKKLLNYDADTGVLSNVGGKHRVKGKVLGTLTDSGYFCIMVNQIRYQSHRLCWLWAYGSFPVNDIDHLNGVRTDNRLSNLADKTTRENAQNLERHRNGGLVGATFYKPTGKWSSAITVNGKCKFLGRYGTAMEAHLAYTAALRDLDNVDASITARKEGRQVGACFHKPTGRWRSYITVDGKSRSLKYFASAQLAYERHRAERDSLKGLDVSWIVPMIHFKSDILDILKKVTSA